MLQKRISEAVEDKLRSNSHDARRLERASATLAGTAGKGSRPVGPVPGKNGRAFSERERGGRELELKYLSTMSAFAWIWRARSVIEGAEEDMMQYSTGERRETETDKKTEYRELRVGRAAAICLFLELIS